MENEGLPRSWSDRPEELHVSSSASGPLEVLGGPVRRPPGRHDSPAGGRTSGSTVQVGVPADRRTVLPTTPLPRDRAGSRTELPADRNRLGTRRSDRHRCLHRPTTPRPPLPDVRACRPDVCPSERVKDGVVCAGAPRCSTDRTPDRHHPGPHTPVPRHWGGRHLGVPRCTEVSRPTPGATSLCPCLCQSPSLWGSVSTVSPLCPGLSQGLVGVPFPRTLT